RPHLRLKVALGNKELMKLVFGRRYKILFVRRTVRNVDDLQKPAVGKTLGRAREVVSAEVERGFDNKNHLQPARIRPDFDRDLIESPGLLESSNRTGYLRARIRLARLLAHQPTQRFQGDLRIGDNLD